MKFAGESGVAAFGVLTYTGFIFVAVFLGYAIGSAPLFGFNHGAKNRSELHNLFGKSMRLIALAGVILTAVSIAVAYPVSLLYVGYDKSLFQMTVHGYIIYSFSFLPCGFNIFASSLFTALNNGLISAVISFSRTLVFQVFAIFLLPLLFGLDGVWFANVLAEFLALGVSIFFFVSRKRKYRY